MFGRGLQVGIGCRPLATLFHFGLALVCLAPGRLRAEPEVQPMPLAASDASQPIAEPPYRGEFPSEAPVSNRFSEEQFPVGSLLEQPATPWARGTERSDSVLSVAATPVRLSPGETSGLLMLQGFLLFGLARRRRRLAAALLALLALTRSGLGALTDFVGGSPKTRAANASPPAGSTAALETRLGVPSPSLERTYAGLLRRLAGEPAAAARRPLFTETDQEPATRLASLARVAGFAVPVALTSPELHIPAATDFAFLPSEGRVLLPPQTLSFALFARPPPPSA